jgi:acyl-[acyl-carrier-protein] desaturase
MPLLNYWRVMERDGLNEEATMARDKLVAYLADLDASARRFEERRAASLAQEQR